MKRISIVLLVLALSATSGSAQQSISSLGITSAKDALQMLRKDSFGSVRLSGLLADIQGDKVYSNRSNYGSGYVEIESDNDPRHFGSINFDFSREKPDFNVTVDEVRSHMSRMGVEAEEETADSASFRWKSNEFSCLVDVIVQPDYKLFQYMCHFVEEK